MLRTVSFRVKGGARFCFFSFRACGEASRFGSFRVYGGENAERVCFVSFGVSARI